MADWGRMPCVERQACKPDTTWEAIYHDFGREQRITVAAMTGSKRTEITIETDQVVIIRRRHSSRAWCRECGSEVDMVGLGEVGALTGMSGQPLQDHAQGRGWHLFEGERETTLICLPSLLKSK